MHLEQLRKNSSNMNLKKRNWSRMYRINACGQVWSSEILKKKDRKKEEKIKKVC